MTDQPLEFTHDGWCVMSRNPVTGVEVHAQLEELSNGTDRWHFRQVVDAEGLVEDNKDMRADNAGRRHGDGLSLVARVPMNVFEKHLMEPLRQGDEAQVRRILNDSDNRAWRVRDGRI